MARIDDCEFEVVADKPTVSTSYDDHGRAHKPSRPDDLALKVEWEGKHGELRYKYFVLADRRNQFYNPWDVYAGRTSPTHRVNDMSVWNLKEVPHESFELYLRFLTTRNSAHLLQAQRRTV